MRSLITVIFVASMVLSCSRGDDKTTSDKLKTESITVKDASVYNELKRYIVGVTSQNTSSSAADSLMKYYILNEETNGELKRVIFSVNDGDDTLFYKFINLLTSDNDNVIINKSYYLLKLTFHTRRAAEWAEVLSDKVRNKWIKPDKIFIENVINLPDTERIFILHQTMPEDHDTINAVINKIESIPNIKGIKGYDNLILKLKEIAASQN